MPKSKPNKVVHLTQVKKKGKDHKQDLLKQLEQYGDQFERVFLFDFEHTKSDRIMLLRTRLKEHGRIFSGKNSLVSLALRNLGSRSRTDYEDLIKQVSGHRGLLFTNLAPDKLIELLEDELPEFRAKLLGCADLKRPAVARSDDEDDGEQADGGSDEDTSDEQERESDYGDSDDEGDEEVIDGDDDDVGVMSSAKTSKSRAKDAARRRGVALVGKNRYTAKQLKESKRKDLKKRQMRLKIESKERQQEQKAERRKKKTRKASGSAATDNGPALEAAGKAIGGKKKKRGKETDGRRVGPGKTVAGAGDAESAGEVSRKKQSGKQKRRRHEVRFESLR